MGQIISLCFVLSTIATCSLQQADERSRQQPPAGGEGAEQGEQSPAQAGAGASRPHRQVGAGAGQGVPGRGNKLRRLHRQPGKTSKTAGDLTDLSILQKEEHLQGLETEKLAREKAKKENLLHETRFGAKPSTPAKLKGESVSSLRARVIFYKTCCSFKQHQDAEEDAAHAQVHLREVELLQIGLESGEP